MNTIRALFVGLLTLTLAGAMTVGAQVAIEDSYLTHQEIIEFGPDYCNWSTGLVVPKFDNSPNGPFAGCYPISVNLEFDGEVSGFFRFENLSFNAGDVTATLSALLHLKNPGGVPILTINPSWTVTEFVDQWDGGIDYAGDSGRSYENILESDSGSVYYDSCIMMNQFSGAGSLNYSAEAYANSSAQGPGQLILQYETNAAVTLTVTYTYYCPECVVWGDMSGSAGEAVTFYSDSIPVDHIVEYRWDFGDGSPVFITNDPEVTHIYEEDGEYTVTLCFTHEWANGQSPACRADSCCELDGSVVRTHNVNWSQIKAQYR